MKKVIQRFFWVFGILIFIFAIVIILNQFERLEWTFIECNIRPYLIKELQFQYPSTVPEQISIKQQLIYVMGGSEESLRERIRKTSQLYHAGVAERILIFLQPGITNFDKSINRNLTNKEWAQKLFARSGVKKKDIAFAEFKEGFWGTLSESRKVIEQAEREGYKHIHIVTSLYHTRRTWLTFFNFTQSKAISISVYDADDVTYLRHLATEYIKLLIYKYILLPSYLCFNL